MAIFILLIAFFVTFALYYLSFKFPNFLIFMSIFINIVNLLIIVYKFGGAELLKTVIR